MAEMIPLKTKRELDELALKSPAEERVYRACEALPSTWKIFHGLRTLFVEDGEGARDREGDFVVLHPGYGLLVIEVKGGRVRQKDGRWTRTLKDTTKDIDDPFAQATAFKHTLLRRLHTKMQWGEVELLLDGARELARHAVLLPDVLDVSVVRGPHIEQEVVGGSSDVDSLELWVERAFRFGSESEAWAPLQQRGVEVAKAILCEEFSTRAILGFDLDEAEARRLVLTHEQFVAARALRTSVALAVAGAAGTGKTVLAFRRARESAAAGLRTLFLCYNRPLADSLGHEQRRLVALGELLDEHLVVNTFDGFAAWIVERAKTATGEDFRAAAEADHPALEDRSELAAIAMEYAIEEHPPEITFDVVLIDEGQDFADAHWRAIHAVLKAAQRWSVFFDPHQAVYRRATRSPVLAASTEQLCLTRNCRNSDSIHTLAYRFYRGEPAVQTSSIEGRAVSLLSAPNLPGQAKRVATELRRWVYDEKVRPGRIAVLAMHALGRADAWQALNQAATKVDVATVDGSHGNLGAVLFDTVKRFKGLEADVVVLWFNGPHDIVDADSLRYVGCSRAKTLLVLVGNDVTLNGMA
ncbi:MAG: NERD domain-containing protein/DEAD/DEAH box helicase [Pseudomonadota bacterium]|nr:NERD domain-containing protein/DEAD/DEAH box helicase [Pseudomonadota bacterium]